MLFQSSCRNCHELEKEIIKLFTSKYIQKTYFGREYFEGDQHSMIGDLCDIVKNEGIIQDVIVEENDTSNDMRAFVSNIIVEETIQDVIVEETIQDIIVEETIQDIIVEENDTSNDMRAFVSNIIVEETIQDVIVEETIQDVIVEETIQDVIVSNVFEEEEEEEVGKEEVNDTKKYVRKAFNCDQCQYSTDIKSSFQIHLKSIKHVLYFQVREKDENCKHQCKVCNKKYLSQPGLWAHNKTCKPPVVAAVQAPPVVDLHKKIDNLERIMMEMAKNLVS
jgi:hypothetical protein